MPTIADLKSMTPEARKALAIKLGKQFAVKFAVTVAFSVVTGLASNAIIRSIENAGNDEA